jgi:hypothetical protein
VEVCPQIAAATRIKKMIRHIILPFSSEAFNNFQFGGYFFGHHFALKGEELPDK